MGKLILSEEEKMDIMNQYNDEINLPDERMILDLDITPISLAKFESQRLTPYYYDGDTSIVELTEPVKKGWGQVKPKQVFLLTPDEYDKVKKMSDNVKKMVDLKLETIRLYKQYIPGVLQKITENK